MAKTIHTLAYQLLVDSSDFEKGMVASRKELNFAKREMRAMATPAEKLSARLERLAALAKKDARFQGLYNRALKDSQKQMKKTAAVSGGMTRRIKQAAAAYLSFQAVLGAGRAIDREIDRMNNLAKTAKTLGTSTEFLTRLQFAAGETSGLSDEQTAKGLEKMTRRISEAAAGTGEAQNAIKELGLDAKALAASGPERALMSIAAAMQNVSNEGDVLRLSTKLFDDEQARLGLTLKQTNSELAAQFDKADQLGKTLSSFDASQAEIASDAINEMSTALGGVVKKIVVELLPAIEKLTGGLKKTPGAIDNAGGTIEAIGRTLGNKSGQLFSNPLAEFRLNAAKTVSERARQDKASLALAKSTARLAAMEKAKEETKQRVIEQAKIAEEEKANAIKTAGVYGTAFKQIGADFMQNIARSGDSPFGFSPDTTRGVMPAPPTATSDPMASITARSSEAFRIQNRVTGDGSELELAKKRTNDTAEIKELLGSINGSLSGNDTNTADIL